ncbi:AMP-binding protein [Pseudoblastomonas halimionae]|uniref:AMP-binding protein n=1 Tax=Alteriqipengyuania halimionae TaxID=1926630 RepID=A0A6I4TZ52_9SPHN|nr:AMP-binding protein [Alteriqipengyuania halimionae]MXP08980.1 AMP-binding protein [Alteriqipengyuania halimionae]
MSLNHGAIQDHPLTLDRIIDHAAKWHSKVETVSARADGVVDRATYAAIRSQARAISARLAALGVEQGECVATLAWNSRDHLAVWYGVMAMGAVCHTLNPRLTAHTLADMLRQSKARVVFASADLQDLAHEIAASGTPLERIVVIDGEAEPHTHGGVATQDIAEFLALEAASVSWGDFDERAPCGLCFTSGTTGRPKGVTYTHRGNYLHTLRQLAADVCGIGRTDTILVAVPMFHANGWGLPFVAPATGARLVLPGADTSPEALAGLIATHRVTIAVAVPTVWLALCDFLDATGRELPSLERIMVGGAPMPAALARRIEARGIEVQTTWGMTELSPLGTASVPGAGDEPSAGSGVPSLGIDLMLADHDGKPLDEQHGREGHLHVRGQSVVERYFGERDPATRDGWFDTGDLAQIGEDGSLSITGRSKDLIKSGGEWINPVAIESLVASLDDVALAAVIGCAHPRWGERPVLIVELRDGADPSDEDLLRPIRRVVPKWWLPDEILRLQAIPLAATGKVDKQRLRIAYAEQALPGQLEPSPSTAA